MPQNDTQNDDIEQDVQLEYNVIQALRDASDVALERFEEMDDMEPTGYAGITELDGRKRLARRLKKVSDETGYRKFEFIDYKHPLDPDDYTPDPDVRWTLKYDSYERSYSLQHEKIDTSQSMPRKAAAYQVALEPLESAGFAKEGRVYSRVE